MTHGAIKQAFAHISTDTECVINRSATDPGLYYAFLEFKEEGLLQKALAEAKVNIDGNIVFAQERRKGGPVRPAAGQPATVVPAAPRREGDST